MRRLIESLLELSRFDAGREPLGRQAADLVQIAEDGIEVLRPMADVKHMTIHTDLSEAPCHVDPGHLGQVVVNLLTNAIEYNREGGEVKVSTFREGDRAVLVVKDNGPGIREEDLPYIFERFYRADTARASASSRTGLGLAISKAIVEAHGGTLVAASEYGHGATFTLSLPAGGQAATETHSAEMNH
jgi:signal transduction histidine kinase